MKPIEKALKSFYREKQFLTLVQSAVSGPTVLGFHTESKTGNRNLHSIGATTKPLLQVFSIPGAVPYATAWKWQQEMCRERVLDPSLPSALLLLEHKPVYTLGRGSTTDNILFDFDQDDSPFELHRVERGGEVTYHGPGQLVGYPIVNLKHEGYKKDLHWYLRQIEEVLIQTLGEYKLPASRVEEHTGVWVESKKLAAIGLSCSRWVTMHGFALNISPDLGAFDRIVPCGISPEDTGRGVGCLTSECQKRGVIAQSAAIRQEAVRKLVVEKFSTTFGVDVEWIKELPKEMTQYVSEEGEH